MKLIQTAERVSGKDNSDNYVFQRSLLAYIEAAKQVSGNVLELGTGSGYGVEIIAPKAAHFTTLDKYECGMDLSVYKNVSFIKTEFPPLKSIADELFDFVISFQVIEHIKNDNLFLKEMHRVLKKGGKAIITTPNIKKSLTRNPWHVREYTVKQLMELMKKYFNRVEAFGVFGKEKVLAYYEINKKNVEKITRFDFLNLQYRLPRQLLQIPYDILNRMNRKSIAGNNSDLTASITTEDYFLDQANDECFDLFYIGEK